MADVRIRVLTPELAAAQYATKGSVTAITKTSLGLGSVDNTADAAKPLSSANVAALALKADATALAAKADGAATTAVLALKADTSAVYTKTQVDDKVAAGVGSSLIREWNTSTRTWPALGSPAGPVFFVSTNDATAPAPTEVRQNRDMWIQHPDAPMPS